MTRIRPLLPFLAVVAAGCGREPAVPPAPVSRPAAVATVLDPGPAPLVGVPAGSWRPSWRKNAAAVTVAAFELEAHPVTNAQFLAFVAAKPEWRRSQVKRLFADAGYLAHWTDDLSFAAEHAQRPVTGVSWFAARAYAAWRGRRLPLTAEWERAEALARGEDPTAVRRALEWCARHDPQLPFVTRDAGSPRVRDLHGVVWEWVDDFATALGTGDARGDAAGDDALFCGAGALAAADPTDYLAFMRFAMRGSLRGAYTLRNLGFRCAAGGDGGVR
jgi:formylglycine-generating enzyme required for sulfatase activity